MRNGTWNEALGFVFNIIVAGCFAVFEINIRADFGKHGSFKIVAKNAVESDDVQYVCVVFQQKIRTELIFKQCSLIRLH